MTNRYVSNSTANGWAVGSDSGAGTSAAAPWLTLEYAISNMTAGDTVIVNDGVYTHASAFFLVNKYGTIRPLNYRAVILLANGAQTNVVELTAAGANTLSFNNFVIDGQATSTYCVQCTGTGSATYNLDGCWFRDGVNDGYYQYLAKNIVSFVGCKATGAMAYSGIRLINHTDPAARIVIDGLELDMTAQAQASGGGVYLQANAAGPSALVRNVFGNVASTANCAPIHIRNYKVVVEGDGKRRISRSGSGSGPLVWINPYNYIKAPNPVIRRIVGDNNSSAATGYLIMVGTDTPDETANNCCDDPIITECDVNGHGIASAHGIVVCWQRPGSVTRNRIRGARYSLLQKGCGSTIVKACTATGTALACAGASGPNFSNLKIGSSIVGTGITAGTTVTSITSATAITLSQAATSSNVTLEFSDPDAPAGLWYDNDLEEGVTNSSGGHCYNKGSSNAVFALNRIKINTGHLANAFEVGADDAGMIATKTNVIANTIESWGAAASHMALVGSGSDASPATFILNNYWLEAGVTGTPWSYGGTTYATLSLWAASRELSYRNASPITSDYKFWKQAYLQALPALEMPTPGILAQLF